jgi:phosphoglycolate phosphatase
MSGRALLFDLDGTLADPREGIVRCFHHTLGTLGITAPSDDELAGYIGPPLRRTLTELLGQQREHMVGDALAIFRERFAEKGILENTVYPGVHDGLGRLRAAGWRLFVATSKPRVYAERIAVHFELHQHFTAVHGAELTGEREAKADLIRHILATEGVAPESAWMVGDRKYDVEGARANGLPCFGVLWGYGSREELTDAGAHALFERFDALVDALLR